MSCDSVARSGFARRSCPARSFCGRGVLLSAVCGFCRRPASPVGPTSSKRRAETHDGFIVGDQSPGVTPVPISNTAVKPGAPMILHRGKVGHRRRNDPVQVNLDGVVFFLPRTSSFSLGAVMRAATRPPCQYARTGRVRDRGWADRADRPVSCLSPLAHHPTVERLFRFARRVHLPTDFCRRGAR